jgi:hypothetical protein
LVLYRISLGKTLQNPGSEQKKQAGKEDGHEDEGERLKHREKGGLYATVNATSNTDSMQQTENKEMQNQDREAR